MDFSSAPRTSFNTCIKGLQISDFDPVACQSPASPWLNSVMSRGVTARQLCSIGWFSYHSVVACFFSVCQVKQTSIKSHRLGKGVKCGEMCGRMDFPLKLKCAGIDFFFLFFFFCCTEKKKYSFYWRDFLLAQCFQEIHIRLCQCLLLVEEIEQADEDLKKRCKAKIDVMQKLAYLMISPHNA